MSTTVQSEVFSFGHAEISLKRFFFPFQRFSNTAKYLMNHTKILPRWQEVFADTQNECTLFAKNNACDPLRFCNKTAILFPSIDAKRKYYEMRREGYKNVYLVVEKLIENKYGIMFTRWVHPVILQRMKGLYSSGSIEWWDNYILKFMSRLRANYEGKDSRIASSLDGNIVVVFTLVPIGFCPAMLAFLYENYAKLWKSISKIFVRASAMFCFAINAFVKKIFKL